MDDSGRVVPGTSLAIIDSTIAQISTDGTQTITALLAGQTTLTATLGTLTATAQVTVMDGTSLGPGTVRWEVPAPTGFTTTAIVQALPAQGMPAFYSFEVAGSSQTLIRALSVDGATLWLSTIAGTGDPVNTAYVVKQGGDGFGGALAQLETQQGSTWSSSIARFDGASGQESWRYISTGLLDYDWAVRSDGMIFVVEKDDSSGDATLVGIDGTTGVTRMRIAIAPSYSEVDGSSGPVIDPYPSQTGAPMVAPDGSVNIEAHFLIDISGGPITSVDRKLSLLKVSPDGAYSWQALEHYANSWPSENPPAGDITTYTPGEVIPDGQDGLLAAWTQMNADTAFYVTYVSGGGTSKYTLPMNGPWYSPVSMVLGENGTAFAAQSGKFVSFNIASGAVNWTWTGSSGSAEMIAASAGNGLVVRDGTHVARIDPTGVATPDAWTGNSIQYAFGDLWVEPGNAGVSAPAVQGPDSIYARRATQNGRNAADRTITLQVYSVLDPQNPGTPLVPDASVTSQANSAISYWRQSAGIHLKWDGVIQHEVGCDPTQGSVCDNFIKFPDYFIVDVDFTVPYSPGIPFREYSPSLSEVYRRFCTVPNYPSLVDGPRPFCQPLGSQLIFTKLLLPGYWPGITPKISSNLNLSLIAASAPGLTVAHELGHEFQLPDCSDAGGGGLAECSFFGSNLMYNKTFFGPGTYLSNSQIFRAIAGAIRWTTSAQ